MTGSAPLLSVQDLQVSFQTDAGSVIAVDGVSFDIHPGETVGVVGESGSGKSVTALSIMRLLPKHNAKITRGRVLFEGRDILSLSDRELRRLRGGKIAMIFQEPMSSLNPVMTIGQQLLESLKLHKGLNAHDGFTEGVRLLGEVGIPSPERRMLDYPHQLSGGMRQRVMIAMALSGGPRLLLADEPTTALDVTIQAQLLDLLLELQTNTGMAMMLITHSMGVIAETADRVVVMYAGRAVEMGGVIEIFDRPGHPYTAGLMGCTPTLSGGAERLTNIPGTLPSLTRLPPGCRFAPRCAQYRPACDAGQPPMLRLGQGHSAACLIAPELYAAADKEAQA